MCLKKEDKRLRFMDAHIDGNNLFFSAQNMNGLFRVEIGKPEADFLCYFDGEEIGHKNLHRQVIPVGEQLYFIPYKGKGVSVYNKRTGKLSFIKMREKEHISVSRAFLIGKDIYMVPSDLKTSLVIFHTESSSYEVPLDLWKNVRSKFLYHEDFSWSVYSSWLLGKELFLCGEDGEMLCADLESGTVHTYKLAKKYRIRNIFWDKNVFYLILTDKCGIVRWDPYTNSCYEYIIKDMLPAEYPPYMNVLRWEEHLLLLPSQTDEILELDEEKNEWYVKTNYIPEEFCREKKKGGLFLGYQFIEDKLLLLPWMGSGMIILSGEGSRLCQICCAAEMDETAKAAHTQFLAAQVFKGNILFENRDNNIDLEHILSVLSELQQKEIQYNENTGMKIWNACS